MKVYNKIPLLLLVFILLIPSMGFQKSKTKEVEIQTLIDAKVAEKVDKFRRERLAVCRERILNRASELADSVILSTAITRAFIDSITRPTPPERPTRPIVRSPIDTTPVAPFFSNDTVK